MKFSENVVKLRKQYGWSQEVLAEKLEVSRQTIYKWESGQSYPEMDRLLVMCELFRCSIDELINSTIDTDSIDKAKEYEHFYNRYAKVTALGVFLILLGVSLMFLFLGLLGENAFVLPIGTLLVFIMIAVAIFIYYGTQEEEFKKSIPLDADYYNAKQRREFSKKMGLGMTIAVALIFLAIIVFITLVQYVMSNPFYPLSIMMLMIGIAVFLMVYYGMLSEKMAMEPKPKQQNQLIEKLNAIIMMIATVIFLLFGFLQGSWHPAWVAFPIGGILCGVVTVLFDNKK